LDIEALRLAAPLAVLSRTPVPLGKIVNPKLPLVELPKAMEMEGVRAVMSLSIIYC
jgi:hypothetical protein